MDKPLTKHFFKVLGIETKEKYNQEQIDEIINHKDSLWKKYVFDQRNQLSKKSQAELVYFELTSFEAMEPCRLAFDYIENNQMKNFLKGDFETIPIPTRDGVVLHGDFFKHKNPKGTIIVVHGWSDVKEWVAKGLSYLYEEGYQLFIYNRRFWNYWMKPKQYIGSFINDINDIEDIINNLKQRDEVIKSNLGILGFSYGANLAIVGASYFPELNFVIADGACIWPRGTQEYWESLSEELIGLYQKRLYCFESFKHRLAADDFNFHYSALEKIKDISPRPVLLLQGEQDEYVPIDSSKALFNNAKEPKQFYSFPSAGHCNAVFSPDKKIYIKNVLNFLNRINDL